MDNGTPNSISGPATESVGFLEFRTRFEGMRVARETMENTRRLIERHTSPNFNIFRVLGVETREVTTHSAMLAWMLNPEATHGQGDLFLRPFLVLLDSLGITGLRTLASLPSNGWTIHCEESVTSVGQSDDAGPEAERQIARLGTSDESCSRIQSCDQTPFEEEGRLDLVLRHCGSETLIVIENKIYAELQKRQLERYHDWLKQKPRAVVWPHQALLYLNLAGDPPEPTPHERVSYHHLSYIHHLAPMLRSVLPTIESPPVSVVVRQYIDLITSL